MNDDVIGPDARILVIQDPFKMAENFFSKREIEMSSWNAIITWQDIQVSKLNFPQAKYYGTIAQ